MKLWLIRIATVTILLLAIVAISNFLIIKYNGTAVPAPTIPRQVQTFGTQGDKINYVVMGDSTSIGQGADYESSIAVATARHLSQERTVNLVNLGVSGARVKDVHDKQLPKVAVYKPGIVLIAVGANDVTHLTRLDDFETSLDTIISRLKTQNPNVIIVLTGSPAMGSVQRFPWPTKQLAGVRTKQINTVVDRLTQKHGIVFSRVAEQTGPIFQKDPSLFAPDKFHPNARGYATWNVVLNKSLDSIID